MKEEHESYLYTGISRQRFYPQNLFSGADSFVYSLAEPRKVDLLPNFDNFWEHHSQQIPDPSSSAQGFLRLFLSLTKTCY